MSPWERHLTLTSELAARQFSRQTFTLLGRTLNAILPETIVDVLYFILVAQIFSLPFSKQLLPTQDLGSL